MSAERRSSAGRAVLASWVVTCGLAYLGVGPYLSSLVEGIDPAQIPRTLPVLALVSLALSLILTLRWARAAGTAATAEGQPPKGLGRRRFLIGAASSVGGFAAFAGATFARISGWGTVTAPNILASVPTSAGSPQAAWKGARVQSYRRLGRTEALVSDVSLGTGQINIDNDGEAIARAAIERGVTYFDTAPDYSGFGSELAMGKAMKGHRERMFLATKFCTGQGHLSANASVGAYVEAIEGSLKRLQTDRVDLIHIHSCDTVERLMSENAHEAFDRLKQQGKARFLGVSTHTPNLEEVANKAIDSGRFDVMMLAYHHGAWPGLAAIVDRAAENDVGVVAMKTLKGAKHRGLLEFRDQADSYTQAAFKWVLANPSVGCLVVSFFEHQHVDEYLYASGKKPTSEDFALLRRYDELIAGKHCFAHCGACLDSCPEQLAINDVLRHRMYFEDYGDQKEAMRLYARLEKGAEVCAGCPAPCVGVCPSGVPIQERMVGAHRMLTLPGDERRHSA